MTSLPVRIETLSFDCYGTLIDWRTGIITAFHELTGEMNPDAVDSFLRVYFEEEAKIQAGPYCRYRSVVEEGARRATAAVETQVADVERFASSVGRWPPFPDSAAALKRLKRCCRIGVLSNVDRDLFHDTQRVLGIEFDFLVTAEDVGGYKPGPGHFDYFERHHRGPGIHVHVAQSLFHDGAPAWKRGWPFVWINRYGELNGTRVSPVAEFATLSDLADAVEDAGVSR